MKKVMECAVLAVVSLLMCSPVYAEYPDKPIEVMIPYGPGGNTDTAGRIFINALRKALDADVVAINVAGAGGTIGMAQMKAKKADGYSLIFAPAAPVVIQPLIRKLPYGEADFAPVCLVADNPAAVTVAPDSPYNSVKELIEASKKGKVVAVGGAPSSIPHIVQAALAKAYDTRFTYLPAGGGGKAAKAVLGGEATFSTDSSSMITNQGLKGLAILAAERLLGLPDVPTLKEQGTDLQISIWFGLLAPKGTPDDVLAKLSAGAEKAVQSLEFLDGMKKAGYVVRFMPQAEFQQFYSNEFTKSKELLKLIGRK